jgi:hypothetical protein
MDICCKFGSCSPVSRMHWQGGLVTHFIIRFPPILSIRFTVYPHQHIDVRLTVRVTSFGRGRTSIWGVSGGLVAPFGRVVLESLQKTQVAETRMEKSIYFEGDTVMCRVRRTQIRKQKLQKIPETQRLSGMRLCFPLGNCRAGRLPCHELRSLLRLNWRARPNLRSCIGHREADRM